MFDFDGTISHRDVLLLFLRHSVPWWRLSFHGLVMAPALARWITGRSDRSDLKRELLWRLYRGRSASSLRRAAANFATNVLPTTIRPAALQCLQWHQGLGHEVVIATANLEWLALPWAAEHGIRLVGTRLEVEGDALTGRLLGANCAGAEKIRRLEALLGSLRGRELYVYGDSAGDHDLLEIATYPFYRAFAARSRPSAGSS